MQKGLWRTLSVLLTAALLCGAAVALGEEAAVRVVDGSFEQLAASPSARTWLLNGRGRVDARVAYDGTASARLDGPNQFQSEWVHTFQMPLVPGREYVLSAWVKATGDSAIASLGLRWPNHESRIYRGLRADDEWQKLELAFTVPESAPPWIQVVLSGEHQHELWWDAVEIVEAQTVRERLAREWAPRLARGEQLYTGLVINAKNLGVLRGMSPRIYDEEGRVLYAGIGATASQVIGSGVVAYTRDLKSALSHERLNVDPEYPLRHPLVIDALDGADTPRTGVVISSYDADVLYEALKEYDFLGRFAVVFVVDRNF